MAIKKRVNSKKKGSGFEGQVAKKLTTFLAPLTFIRSPGSGARVGGKNFALYGNMFGEEAMKLFVGDVCPTNEKDVNLRFRWSIECKSYKTPDTFPHLALGTANVFKWFEESVVDAPKTNRLPALIFKWNQSPTFVAIKHFPFPGIKPMMSITYADNKKVLDFYLFDEALKIADFWCTPHD